MSNNQPVWHDGYFGNYDDDDMGVAPPHEGTGKCCRACRLQSEILSKEPRKVYCIWEGKHVWPDDPACRDFKNWTIRTR